MLFIQLSLMSCSLNIQILCNYNTFSLSDFRYPVFIRSTAFKFIYNAMDLDIIFRLCQDGQRTCNTGSYILIKINVMQQIVS